MSSSSEESSDTWTIQVAEVLEADVALSYRAEGVRQITERLTSPPPSPVNREAPRKEPRLTPNIQALILTSILFSTITAVQVIAARIANSQALLMDCVSMGVDALTYMGNIIVECRKRDGAPHEGSQIIVCAISLTCLIYFTIKASEESLATIQVCIGATSSDEPADDVNGYITLAFGAGGVVFDLISLWAFYRGNRKQGGGHHVNMFTALLHVGADFLRSVSTVVMSMLILYGGFDSTCLDAYTSMLIGATIVAGAGFGIMNWAKLVFQWARKMSGRTDRQQPAKHGADLGVPESS